MTCFQVGRVTILKPYVRFARDLGLPVDRELGRANLPIYHDDFPDAWVSYPKIQNFVDWIVRREPEALPVLSGVSTDPDRSIHPAVWRPLKHTVTLRQALKRLPVLSRNHVSGFHGELIECRDPAVFRFSVAGQAAGTSDAAGVQESRSIGMLIGVIRAFAGSQPGITRAFLSTRSKKVQAATTELLDGVPVMIGQPCSGLEFASDLLLCSRLPSSASPELQDPEKPSPGTTIADRLILCLESYLPQGHPNIRLAADLANMSVRGLQRRLAASGTTHELIVDTVRCRTALRLLAAGETNLSEIAHTLGYSEQSSFNRAFLRWTGKSPNTWRRASEGLQELEPRP